MARYKSVRSFRRGLEILKALNLRNGVRAQDLNEVTGIHRATIYRLLETLREAGFVEKSVTGDAFYLTRRVQQLSAGVSEESHVPSVVGRAICELQRQVQWPTDFATYEKQSMVIRETTHHISPLSVHRIFPGQAIPVLHCALGHAYLSHCDDDRREAIIRALSTTNAPDRELARNRTYIDKLLRMTRDRGYGISPRIFKLDAKTDPNRFSALAVPVLAAGKAIGSVNVVFFSSSVSQTQAEREFLPLLLAAAKTIGEESCRRN